MPKILIISACLVNCGGDIGTQSFDVGEFASPDKDTAAQLVAHKRALFADAKDDPSKGNLDTASAEMLKQAAVVAKERAKAATKKTPADTPPNTPPDTPPDTPPLDTPPAGTEV